jgi:hypothetical protein
MGFPKYVISGPITINGQNLKLHNNSPSSDACSGYNVASMYGRPTMAQWVGVKVQFTTDKGRAFRTDGSTLSEFK